MAGTGRKGGNYYFYEQERIDFELFLTIPWEIVQLRVFPFEDKLDARGFTFGW